MSVNINQLKGHKKDLENLLKDISQLMIRMSNQEGLVVVGEVKQRTPVSSGNLIQMWNSKVIVKSGVYEILISNNVEYAAYVEKGFRSHFVPGYYAGGIFVYAKGSKTGMYVGKKGSFVKGKWMLRDGINFYQQNLIKDRLQRFWKDTFKQYLE